MSLRIGVMTWVYVPQLYPIEDAVSKLVEDGIHFIGLDGARTQLDSRYLPSKNFLDRLSSLGKNLGVEFYQMHSCHGGASSGWSSSPTTYGRFCCAPVDIASSDEEARSFSIRATIEQVIYCSQLSCKRLTVHPGSGYESSPDLKVRLVDSYRQICEAAEKHGVEILIENLAGQVYCSTVDDILDLIYAIDEENLGILIDTGHAVISGSDLCDEVRKAGRLLHGLHCHDNDGKSDLHRVPVPGIGVINWNNFIDALIDVRYNGPFMLEVFHGDSVKGISNKPEIPLHDIRRLPERLPTLHF